MLDSEIKIIPMEYWRWNIIVKREKNSGICCKQWQSVKSTFNYCTWTAFVKRWLNVEWPFNISITHSSITNCVPRIHFITNLSMYWIHVKSGHFLFQFPSISPFFRFLVLFRVGYKILHINDINHNHHYKQFPKFTFDNKSGQFAPDK